MRKISYCYQLHIQLCATKPAVWRRLLIDESTNLAQLHQIIQTAMGWENKHLYMFEIAGQRYGTPDADWPDDPTMDARRYTIGQLLRRQSVTMRYLYDFGDEWLHRIKLEACVPMPDSTEDARHQPTCLAGRNACPPENCGGSVGFTELLHALLDSTHPNYATATSIYEQGFDPQRFELQTVQQQLQTLELDKPKPTLFKSRPTLMAA